MQKQLQTELTPEQTYTPLAASPVELTELTSLETREEQRTEGIEQWLSKIQRKARRDKKWMLFFQLFIFLPISLISFLLLTHNNFLYLMWLALLFVPVVGMTVMGVRASLKKPTWNAEELARLGGVNAVGTLLDLLMAPGASGQRTQLYAALTELLPHMKAGDAAMLTAVQRGILLWLLKEDYAWFVSPAVYQNYRLAILKALEQIGDADAIPVVEHLANGRARTAEQQALKAAALECLPLLRVKSQSVEAPQTLLRASLRDPSASGVLLRPAAFAADANPQQLLRADDSTAPPPSASGTPEP